MTTEAPIVVQGTADLSKMIAEQERLRQSTRDLATAYGVSEASVKSAQTALQRQQRAMKQVDDSVKKSEARIRSFRQVAANTFGDVVNDMGDVAQAATFLGSAAGPLAAVAVGIGAIVGAGLLLYGAVSGINALAQAAATAYPDVAGVVSLQREQQQALEQLPAAYAALEQAQQAIIVQMGAQFAPVVLDGVRALGALGFVAADAVGALSRAGDSALTFLSRLDEGIKRVTGVGRIASNLLGGPLLAGVVDIRDEARDFVGPRQPLGLLESGFSRFDAAMKRTATSAASVKAQIGGRGGVGDLLAEVNAETTAFFGAEQDRTIADGARLQAEQERQAQAAAAASAARSAELIRQREAEAAAAKAAQQAQQDYIVAGVRGVADLIEAAGAGAQAVRAAQLIATLAYQATAFARSVAELGPIAGIPAGLAIAGTIAGYIAQAREAGQSHMGSGGRQLSQGPGAPDEEMVRIRRSQSVVSGVDLQRRDDVPIVIALDNQMYEAASARSTRVGRLYGRKGRAS